MKELIIIVGLPMVFVFTPFFLYRRTVFYRKLDVLEKYIVNLSFSTFLVSLLLVLVGLIFSSSFKLFSLIIFYSSFLILLILLIKNFELILKKTKDFRKLFISKKTFFKQCFLVVFLFLIKIALFCIFKPVIDSDVVNSYLPFARSIFLSDKIPERNFYDNSIMLFPPIGGVVFYALFYSLSGNILTESFRLFPLIYILGIVILCFKIFEKIGGKRVAYFSTILFTIFPFWDGCLMDSLFYPDVIALFLFLTFFYFFLKEEYFLKLKKKKLFLYFLISCFLGATLFFKIQYLIVYYFLGLFYLVVFLPRRWGSVFWILLGLIPILYRLKRGIGYQLKSYNLVFVFALMVFFALVLGFWRVKRKKFSIKPLFLAGFSFLIGFSIHFRNYLKYGSFLSPVTKGTIRAGEIVRRVGIYPKVQDSYVEWVVFFLPALAIFWLIVKVIGLFLAFKKSEKTYLTVLFAVVWYAVITLLFYNPNPRSLMPVIPFLALWVGMGVEGIIRILKVNEEKFKISFLAISIVFSMLSSIFLWWNGGLLVYGRTDLRRLIDNKILEKKDVKEPELTAVSKEGKFGLFLNDFVVTATSRGYLYEKNFKKLLILGFVSSVVLLLGGYFLRRKISYRVFILIAGLCFSSYFLVMLLVSGGKIWKFKEIERRELYNYWGQGKYVIPYMKKNIGDNGKVIYWGVPTGVGYFLNRPAYNLLYNYSLGEVFYEVVNEEDKEKVYQFFKENGFEYIIISSRPEDYNKYQLFRRKTKMLDILDDSKYAKLVMEPKEDNFWYVYKLK